MINNEEFTTCPYNSTHRVVRSRIQHHIVKCQKNNPKLMSCPFNATHRYPEHELQQHCMVCPNKRQDKPKPMARQTESIGATTTPKPILQKEYLPEMDPDNDYWDD